MKMRNSLPRFGAIAGAGVLVAMLVGAAPQPAAAIECDGNFQITSHGPIATPYCEDNHLAAVAREYGMRVSNEAIRYNPSVKERACRFVGNDIRVKSTCQRYLPSNDRDFWR